MSHLLIILYLCNFPFLYSKKNDQLLLQTVDMDFIDFESLLVSASILRFSKTVQITFENRICFLINSIFLEGKIDTK